MALLVSGLSKSCQDFRDGRKKILISVFRDPYGKLGYTFSGPGVRIPLMLISPFTRGGHVFTERADHSSMIQFLGKN